MLSARSVSVAAAVLACGLPARPVSADPMLADFAYPHPVAEHRIATQGQTLSMAYMDVRPEKPNGRTIVFLHGKNFCGATWEGVIRTVTAAGYRAVVPDQIGFCKSSKPETYIYGLHELASNTRQLIEELKITKPILVGHSMGGMLALRYALSFPDTVSGLVLVNPIGLEDWRAKGVPERTFDELFVSELKTDRARIKAYQQTVYYGGNWKPEYDRWVDMLASMYAGPGLTTVARAQAATSRMIFSDPVIYELERIPVPVALMVGEKDTTAIGRDRAAPEIAKLLGDYPALARAAAARIPKSTLVTWPGLGHSPHIEDPARFSAAFLAELTRF